MCLVLFPQCARLEEKGIVLFFGSRENGGPHGLEDNSDGTQRVPSYYLEVLRELTHPGGLTLVAIIHNGGCR